ncbi:hypothetical protein ABMA27_016224 [Loxostege sticticalis]|uniref:Uncharacterized protein n=1 Tax=Loxostege sticticalis TaxID=481309 RepID=A0ABR3I615_LOXSC
MIESRNFQVILYFFLIVLVLEGDSRRPRLKEEKQSERRDYRPSKWVANSAMDVWYGNKSMVDILSREFSDVMNRIASRPVRSPVPTKEENSNVTKLTMKNPADEGKNDVNSENMGLPMEYNPGNQAEDTKHYTAEKIKTTLVRDLKDRIIPKVKSDSKKSSPIILTKVKKSLNI